MTNNVSFDSFLTDYNNRLQNPEYEGGRLIALYTELLNRLGKESDMNKNVVMDLPEGASKDQQEAQLQKVIDHANVLGKVSKSWGRTILVAEVDDEIGPHVALIMANKAFEREDLSDLFRMNVASKLIELAPDCFAALDSIQANKAIPAEERKVHIKRQAVRVMDTICNIHDSNLHPMLSSNAGIAVAVSIHNFAKDEDSKKKYPYLAGVLYSAVVNRDCTVFVDDGKVGQDRTVDQDRTAINQLLTKSQKEFFKSVYGMSTKEDKSEERCESYIDAVSKVGAELAVATQDASKAEPAVVSKSAKNIDEPAKPNESSMSNSLKVLANAACVTG